MVRTCIAVFVLLFFIKAIGAQPDTSPGVNDTLLYLRLHERPENALEGSDKAAINNPKYFLNLLNVHNNSSA